MGISVNRGPWNLNNDEPHERRGESPGSRSSPSNAAADSGHLGPHTAGKGWTPLSRRDNVPVTGENRAVADRK